jgi:hypothetical protein
VTRCHGGMAAKSTLHTLYVNTCIQGDQRAQTLPCAVCGRAEVARTARAEGQLACSRGSRTNDHTGAREILLKSPSHSLRASTRFLNLNAPRCQSPSPLRGTESYSVTARPNPPRAGCNPDVSHSQSRTKKKRTTNRCILSYCFFTSSY